MGTTNGKFKVVAKENLILLRTNLADDSRYVPKNEAARVKRAKNARIFAKKVLNVLQGKDPEEPIKLSNIVFDVQNAGGRSLWLEPITNLNEEDGINHFLLMLNNRASTLQGTYSLVAKTKKGKRRLIETRPVPCLYNRA